MKKSIILILTILLAMPFALAQETQVQNKIYPDSPLWFFDRGLEKAQLFWHSSITRNPIALAERKLINSRERNLEMQQMIFENKPDSYQKSFKAFNEDLENINVLIVQIPEGLRKNIQLGLEKSLSNLEQLREQLPEQARSGLDNAIQVHEQTIQRTNEEVQKAFNKKYDLYLGILEATDSGTVIDDE